ncbi:hypothetical protein ACE193_23600 [Bernardetia sp. OM2101]|uniref:hypothetical protein n=1 Tax=Bernardetia sp. OM2101 TaxID=3344876 RepID=UPI0035D0F2C7
MIYLVSFLLFICLFFLIKKQLQIRALNRKLLSYELKREKMRTAISQKITEKGLDIDLGELDFLLKHL